mgnify:CR=1 FL=1
MERLNKIFAEWAKQDKRTELASQKVELGLIDDLNKALDSSEQIIDRLKEGNALIKRDKGFLEKDEKESVKLFNKAQKAADIYFKKEDELLLAKKIFEDATKKRNSADEQLKSKEESINELQGRIASYQKSKVPVAKKAQNLITVFEKNIKKAEAAAKDLGLKLPIAKYTKAQDNLRKNL